MPYSPSVITLLHYFYKPGNIHIFTGNGKGKTTAAFGIALRAALSGYKSIVIQFLKGADYTGEIAAAEDIPSLEIKQFGRTCPFSELKKRGLHTCENCRDCFIYDEEDNKYIKEAYAFAIETVSSGKYDLVILDEINIAASIGSITSKDIIKLILCCHKDTELILTGRNAPTDILSFADSITSMVEIKHPLNDGIPSRYGIEY